MLALAPASAPAQVIRAFTPRFTVNDVGDVYVIGNTSMSCDIADVDCANARNRVGALLNNNNFVMEYVDVDGDVSTFSSSSADFTVPSGGTVLFAGLYWGGRSSDANRYSVQLATPTSGGYVSLTATQQDIDAAGQRYSGFIDVTALVQAGGTGTYAVANVLGQPGQTNRYAGWSLVVVVRDPSATIRSMAVFDGYAEVTTTTPSVNIPVTGLLTPPTGPVNTRMGAVAYEGDLNLTGDELQLNGVAVGDAESPATNFFNSSISRLGVPLSSKNPDYLNQLSFDADIVDVTPFGAIGNGATSATITLTTSGDFYWPAAVTFVTDLFEPVIQPNFLKTVTDINGGVVQPGDILEYALALENSGNDAALNVALADTLPANTSYVSGSVEILAGANAGTKSDVAGDDQAEFEGAVGPAGRVVVRLGTGADASTGGTLGPGEITALRFRVVVQPATPDGTAITNQAGVDYSGATIGTVFNAQSNLATVNIVSEADLGITKDDGRATINQGDVVSYTIVASNSGPMPVTGATVTDNFSVDLSGVTWTCSASAGSTCPANGSGDMNVGVDLLPGGAATFSATGTVVGTGTLTNTASVTTPAGVTDPDPSDNTATDSDTQITPTADVVTTKTGPSVITASATFTYTVSSVNAGLSTAADVTVSDTLPPSVAFLSATGGGIESGGVVTWPAVASMAPGGGVSFDVTVRAPTAGTITNVVASTSSTIDRAPANNDGSDATARVVTTVTENADIEVTKSGPSSSLAGQPIDYTITVRNIGPSVAANVAVSDTLPTGASFVSASGGGAQAGGVVNWPTITSMASGASTSFTLRLMPGGPAMYTNVAAGESATPDPDSSNNNGSSATARVITAVQGSPDLAIAQQQQMFTAGLQGSFDLRVVNEGVLPTAGDITIVNNLPAGLTYTSGSGTGWTLTAAGQVVTATRSTPLAPGDTALVSIATDVAESIGAQVSNSATVSTAGDLNSSNDTVTGPFDIGRIDLAITKAAVGDFVVTENGTFTISVTNVGNTITTGSVTVTDTLPAGLTLVSGTGVGWTVGATGSIVTATNTGPIAPGDTVTMTLTVTIGPEALPTVINSAVVVTPGDQTAAGNSIAVTSPIDVRPPSDLFLEKTASRRWVDLAEVLGYTVRVQNVGTRSIPDVVVDDLLPAGFKYLAGTARLDGAGLADPDGAPGEGLSFVIDTVAAGATLTLSYQVAVGAGAELGDGINRAQASSASTGAVSNTAMVEVELRSGPFSDQGFITGKVFVQCDCAEASLQESEELGIPGVRVFLQNGISTVTDAEGKYNFIGLSPRLYVLRVDETTLPAGATLVPGSNRHAEDGASVFVDLIKGEMHRADFSARSGAAATVQEVKARRQRGEIAAAIRDTAAMGPMAAPRSGERLRLSDTPYTSVRPAGTLDEGNTRLPVPPGENTMRWPDPDAPQQRIRVTVPETSTPADGETAIPVRIDIEQPSSVTGDSVQVTLEATAGRWLVEDANDSLPGIQTTVQSSDVLLLEMPADPGDITVRVTESAEVSGIARIAATPPERPLLITGLLEGRFDFRSRAGSSFLPGRKRDRFQDELEALQVTGSDGRVEAAARGAIFVKGSIADEALVTLRFDTERDDEQTLFRDIRPDEFYPIYGDASVKQFDAQSKGRFYARIDRGRTYLLFGDYNTAVSPVSARLLGAYNRSLTGALQHFETKRLVANLYASRDRQRQIVDEIPALGISGPYALSRSDGLINSEKVEILTRDRNQPAEILRIEPLARFTDYTLEPFTSRLVLRRPVPSVDENLNPVSIRITYEIEQGGDKFWVAGLDATVKPIDRIEIGGSLVHDDNGLGNYDIGSANATVELATNTFITGEFARSDSANTISGNGTRVELTHRSRRFDGRAFFSSTDTSFINPSSGFVRGRQELGFRARAIVNERTRIVGEALRTERRLTGGNRLGAQLFVERRMHELINAELGFRHAKETDEPADLRTTGATPNETNALRAKVTGRLPWVWDASIFGELEQDVATTSQRRAAIGGDVNVLQRARVYAQHEFISSLAGPYALNTEQQRNTTVIGISSAYLEGAEVFSEYRVRDAIAGREAQAAIGLRNRWTLGPGIRVNTSFERVSPLGDSQSGTATAVTGAVEYTRNPLWRGTARLEFRASETADNLFASLGFARKLSRDWSFLGQSAFGVILGGGRAYERTRVGVAYRETDRNRWNLLARYENRFEKNPDPILGEQRSLAHIFSGHADYRASAALLLRGQLAAKFATENFQDAETNLQAYLLSLRATYDITRRWDLGLTGRTLADGGFASIQYGIGAEAGFLLINNLRLAGGYNVFGFNDNELTEDSNSDHGFYVDVQFKFSEGSFGFLR